MNKKKMLKRIVASVLTIALAFNVVPMGVFAEEANSFEVKRGGTISVSEMIETLVSDKSGKVSVNVSVDVNGENVSKTLEGTLTEVKSYFVDGVKTDAVDFSSNGSHTLTKATGSVEGNLNADAQSEFNSLVDSAKAKDTELENAKEEAKKVAEKANTTLAEAKVKTNLAEGVKSLAEADYNNAVTAEKEAQEAYDKALAAPNNLEAAVQEKKDALQEEKDALEEDKKELETAETNLANWKAKNGYNSQAEIEAAIKAKQNTVNSCNNSLGIIGGYCGDSNFLGTSYCSSCVQLNIEIAALNLLPDALQDLEDAIDDKKADIEAQQAKVDAAQKALDDMNEEEQKALLQKDIDDALVALNEAKATTVEKETAKNTAVTNYNNAVAAQDTAQTAADNANTALTDAENAVNTEWAEAKAYIENLTIGQVTFKADSVDYNAQSNESYGFKVTVYDVLTIETNNASATITVEGADKDLGNGTYKVVEGNTGVKVSAPAVSTYKFDRFVKGESEVLTEDGGKYSVGALTADTIVTAIYKPVGGSMITVTPSETATIVIKGGNEDITTSGAVASGTELTVEVTPATGYSVDVITVTDKDNKPVKLENNKFVANTVTEDEYKISVTTKFIGNIVKLGTFGENVKSVALFVGEDEYTVGTIIGEAGETISIKPTANDGYRIDTITVKDSKDNNVSVFSADSVFSFVAATAGETYTVSIGEDGVTDIRSTVILDSTTSENVTVTVKVGEDAEKTLAAGETISNILPGTEVTVTIAPDEGYYVETCSVENATGSNLTYNKSVAKIKFTTGNTKTTYTIKTTVAPILEGKDAQINKFIVLKWLNGDATSADVKAEILDKAFTMPSDLEPVEVTYLAGTVNTADVAKTVLSDLINNLGPLAGGVNGLIDNLNGSFEVWSSVEATASDLYNKTADDIIAELVKINLIGSTVEQNKDSIKAKIVAALENTQVLHTFGMSEDGKEAVKAKHECADDNCKYQSASADATITIVDTRKATGVDVNTEISVVYGSYATDSELIEKLLKDKLGVYYLQGEGEAAVKVALGAEYNNKLKLVPTLVGTDVNSTAYEVAVEFPDDDYNYKGATSETVKVTITKAPAKVDVANDVVKYQTALNGELTKEKLIPTLGPDKSVVKIDDTVNHIAFVMGIDALMSDLDKVSLVATVDLSQMLYSGDDPAIRAIMDTAVNEILAKINNGGVSYSELKSFISEALGGQSLESLLANAGLDDAAVASAVAAFDQLETMLGQFDQYADITIKFVNSEAELMPKNHGVYVVGAVTTDNNYNTAYDAGMLIIAAEPVRVNFMNDNGVGINHDRQFTYTGDTDADRKTMTAIAFDEAGVQLTDGVMSYRYFGMESDGEIYFSNLGPNQAGAYTVAAMYRDVPAAPTKVGFAVGAMAIWPSDEVEVGVSNKVATFNETAPQYVTVKDMVSVIPADTDAKVAIITAGINVEGDFSEEGASALAGNVNIDFPARVDKVLAKYLPDAYENGVDIKTVEAAVEAINEALETQLGISSAAMTEVLDVVKSIPNAVSLTFKDIDTDAAEAAGVQPKTIGAYLVGAVVFDPNYMPEAGLGVLVIKPATTEEVLQWTYTDKNNIITLPIIEDGTVTLDAIATVKPSENTAKIKYLIAGINEDGETVLITTENVKDVAALAGEGFGLGSYVQVAYIWDGLDATMTLAQPIVRDLVIVPQTVNIVFEDVNDNNMRALKYNGYAQGMPIEGVYYLGNGEKATNGTLTLRYVGADIYGNEYNGTTKPTNVGIYAVYAEYVEKAPNTNDIAFVGMNTGVLAITPAEISVDVEIDDVVCDCGCDEKSCTKANPCCTDCSQVDLDKAIEVSGVDEDEDIYKITVITDTEGNVIVIAPWYTGESVTVNNIDKAIENFIAEIAGIESAYSNNKASEALDKLIKELEAVETTAVDNALEQAKDKIVDELNSITTDSIKKDLKAIYNYVDELDLSSPESIAKAAQAIRVIADKVEATDAQLAATLDNIAAEVEGIDAQTAATAAKTAKAALAIAAQAVKDADLTSLKAEAKAIRDRLVAEIESIDATTPGAVIDEELAKAIENLKALKAEVEAAEATVNTAVDQFKAALNGVELKSFAVNNGTPDFTCYGTYTVTVIAFGPNYQVNSDTDTFTITPPQHVHTGGVANCVSGAICDDENCKEEYTAKDMNNHVGETELRYARAATATEDGYTGDLYCKSCGNLIKLGEKIPATGTTGGTTGTTTSDAQKSDTAETKSEVADTSDSSMTVFWMFIVVVSAATIMALLILRRREREE